MVDKEVILDRMEIINISLRRLGELANIPEKEFTKNDDYYAIAEHHLRRAIEATLDIGRHICVKNNLGQPQDYTEIFDILDKGGVLKENFAEKIRGMAGYRNRLVHMYNEVAADELYQILQKKLDDFKEFTDEIMHYINNCEDKNEVDIDYNA